MSQKFDRITDSAVIVAALATIPLVILQERGPHFAWLVLADWIIWCVFAATLALGTFHAEDRVRYLRRHPIDIAVVVLSFPMLPAMLALARLARIGRVLRVTAVVARSIPALKATIGRRELLYVNSICLLLMISASGALVILEPETVGRSFANALWWSVVTVTTVGYGDIAPTTLPGRAAGVAVILAGLGVISTLSASIAAYFVDQNSKSSQSDLKQIEERLKRIEAILDRELMQRSR